MSKYSEKLKDPRWQKKRLEVLQLRGWACEVCKHTTKTLHVHHSIYLKGKDPWEYEENYLRVLCDECHAEEHDGAEQSLQVFIDFLRGYHGFLFSEIDSFLTHGFDLFMKERNKAK